MERDKKVYRKYHPNSTMSDVELTNEVKSFRKLFPHVDLESFFLNRQIVWSDFQRVYPRADLAKFEEETVDGRDGVFFKGTNLLAWGESGVKVDRLNPSIVDALGAGSSSFPASLLSTIEGYPVMATPWGKPPSLWRGKGAHDMLCNFRIHVSLDEGFDCKFRNVFKEDTITFRTAKQSRRWLSGPNFIYWPQQLNFCVWCATSGCGVSLEGIDSLPVNVQGFLRFHVYFTVRRLLYELGTPLPDDAVFYQTNNAYDRASFGRLCNEFGLEQNADFRWKGSRNHGLGDIFLHYSDGYASVHRDRPNDIEGNTWPDPGNLFDDEGATSENGLGFSFIKNVDHGGNQYLWFMPRRGKGLTQAGMGRLNRSVEAFVYCILGAQVNVRSSIVGVGGSAVEAQQEALILFESMVIDQDISKSVQRYQLAVQEAKLRLDFAIAPGIWLMPSSLIINTESVVGYNNKLMKANSTLKFGVNDEVNVDGKNVGIDHNMGQSKVILPHQNKAEIVHTPNRDVNIPRVVSVKKATSPTSNSHENNLIALTVAAAGVGWYLFR